MSVHALLVSSGFSSEKIYNKVGDLVKDRNYKTAQIITTAHPKKEEASWAKITKEQLENLKLKVSFVDFDNGESISDDTDVIYVCGGNTFHLLHSIQQSSFSIKDQLQNFFDNGGLYIGSSAGAVIFSPTISSAGEIHPDKNYDGITDVRGFNYISQHIIPHYTRVMDDDISAFMLKHNLQEKEIVRLKNGEGVYVYGGNSKIIK